jgi:hypothetical protein
MQKISKSKLDIKENSNVIKARNIKNTKTRLLYYDMSWGKINLRTQFGFIAMMKKCTCVLVRKYM